MHKRLHSDMLINLALIVVSALLWPLAWHLNAWVFADLRFGSGIGLIYFPAGIRLAIILVFGVWGAVGIALSNPALFMNEFSGSSALEIATNSLISGFIPLLTVIACNHALGVKGSLSNLRSVHFPVLALAVSVTTPLAYNLMFLVYDLKPWGALWQNYSAMVLGDFLGCMIALFLLKAIIVTYRTVSTNGSENRHNG